MQKVVRKVCPTNSYTGIASIPVFVILQGAEWSNIKPLTLSSNQMDRLSPGKSPTSPLRKSLTIPTKTPPEAYKAYVEHPEVATLNQIMLHYLDMEEILKLYRQDHEQFETRQALDTLSLKYKLPSATTFKQLLRDYDMQYATVRSYLYKNRNPKKILYQAALEGNIQAFYNQLKLYPKLRKEELYTGALARAAQGGHEAIIELLFELGAKDKHTLVLTSAATGGQLALVQKELAKGSRISILEAVGNAAKHRHKAVVAALLDYRINSRILTEAMEGAGQSGDADVIAYVISRGGSNYKILIASAVETGHFDIVRQYYNKLTRNSVELNTTILKGATSYADLDMIKFIVERNLVTQDRLENSLKSIKYQRKDLFTSSKLTNKPNKLEFMHKQIAALDSIIVYLENRGVGSNYVSESSESSG